MAYDSGFIRNPLASSGGVWTYAGLPSGALTATIPAGTQAYCSDVGYVYWSGTAWISGSNVANTNNGNTMVISPANQAASPNASFGTFDASFYNNYNPVQVMSDIFVSFGANVGGPQPHVFNSTSPGKDHTASGFVVEHEFHSTGTGSWLVAPAVFSSITSQASTSSTLAVVVTANFQSGGSSRILVNQYAACVLYGVTGSQVSGLVQRGARIASHTAADASGNITFTLDAPGTTNNLTGTGFTTGDTIAIAQRQSESYNFFTNSAGVLHRSWQFQYDKGLEEFGTGCGLINAFIQHPPAGLLNIQASSNFVAQDTTYQIGSNTFLQYANGTPFYGTHNPHFPPPAGVYPSGSNVVTATASSTQVSFVSGIALATNELVTQGSGYGGGSGYITFLTAAQSTNLLNSDGSTIYRQVTASTSCSAGGSCTITFNALPATATTGDTFQIRAGANNVHKIFSIPGQGTQFKMDYGGGPSLFMFPATQQQAEIDIYNTNAVAYEAVLKFGTAGNSVSGIWAAVGGIASNAAAFNINNNATGSASNMRCLTIIPNASQGQNIIEVDNSAQTHLKWFLDQNNNFVTYGAATTPATTDTNGFMYVSAVAGAPTGVPASLTGEYANAIPMRYDTTNHKIWFYDGAWKGVVVS